MNLTFSPTPFVIRVIPVLVGGLWIVFPYFLSQSEADLIWLKDRDSPLYGWVVEQKSDEVHFRIHPASLEAVESAPAPPGLSPDSPKQEGPSTFFRVFNRTEIRLVYVTIDESRLQKLQPPDWDSYRDFAEELSSQQLDPTARELAIRLFLIAAKHGSNRLRESSLKGLCSLAQTDQERLRWQALQMWEGNLPDPDSRERFYKMGDPMRVASAKTRMADQAPEEIIQTLSHAGIQWIRAIRQGTPQEFLAMSDDTDLAQAWQTRWGHVCSLETLRRFSQQDRLTGSQLRMLLELEHHLIKSRDVQGFSPSTVSLNWESTAECYPGYTLSVPSFENATGFDPAETIYRNGKWQRPD